MEDRQICGECKWHIHDEIDDGWVCCNADSDYCTYYTEYEDTCREFEQRGIE